MISLTYAIERGATGATPEPRMIVPT